MKIKNIIFDVGNVIVKWSPIKIIENTFPSHAPLQQKFLLEKIFKSDTWINLNLGKISEEEAKLKFLATIEEINKEQTETLFSYVKLTQELIPGTVEIIASLHQNNYPLFALTDNIKEIIHYLKDRYDFWKYFNHVTVSANIGLMKPNKEIFSHVLQENNIMAEESLFIDDFLPNIDAAKSLGFHTILFSDSLSCQQAIKSLGIAI